MQMVKQMYILGTNTAVGGLNVERLTAVRNVAGGVEWRKNYVLKMKLHFEKTLLSLCVCVCVCCLFNNTHMLKELNGTICRTLYY